MRRTGCLFYFASCLAVCFADIKLSVPTSFGVNQPMTVSWSRLATDPPQFSLQTIKFATFINTQQELISVVAEPNTLSGTASIISRFGGPHIILAMDATTNRIMATSDEFDVLDGTVKPSPLPPPTSPSVPNSDPVPNSASAPDSAPAPVQQKAKVPIGSIVGAVIGGLIALVLGILAYLFFRRRLRRKYGVDNTPEAQLYSNEKPGNWPSQRIPSPPPVPTLAPAPTPPRLGVLVTKTQTAEPRQDRSPSLDLVTYYEDTQPQSGVAPVMRPGPAAQAQVSFAVPSHSRNASNLEPNAISTQQEWEQQNQQVREEREMRIPSGISSPPTYISDSSNNTLRPVRRPPMQPPLDHILAGEGRF